MRRQGWRPKDLVAGEEVIFDGYAGKVDETRGSLARIAKVAEPDRPLFAQGGPGADTVPK